MKHQAAVMIIIAAISVTVVAAYLVFTNGDADAVNNNPVNNGSANNTSNATGYQYSIQQAVSDQAQLDTIAFSGLGFLTGNLTSYSFLPPGKVADFFGFQYLRDTTQAGQGHSTDFVTIVADNVLYILNSQQKGDMIALAENQTNLVNEYAYDRYPLMAAFGDQLAGDFPNGTSGLSEEAVANYSANLYEIDANISIQRALLYAEIINSLNDSQKGYLDNMIKGGFASWPSLPDQLAGINITHDENVLVMTYAGDIFSWYSGNVTSDTYFCPERQADYFGGFYIKDAPGMGVPGYVISESTTGDEGQAFLAVLNSSQRPIITNLVGEDRSELMNIVNVRSEIAADLRNALTSGTVNATDVILLEKEYGALDGQISYNYAIAFSEVGQSLTSVQRTQLMNISNISDFPTKENTIYLYSDLISEQIIPNTNFLFG